MTQHHKPPLGYRSRQDDKLEQAPPSGALRSAARFVAGLLLGFVFVYGVAAIVSLVFPSLFKNHGQPIGGGMVCVALTMLLTSMVVAGSRRWFYVGMLVGGGLSMLAGGLFAFMFSGMHGS